MSVSGLLNSAVLPALVISLVRHFHDLNFAINQNIVATLKEHESELIIHSLKLQKINIENHKSYINFFNNKVKCQ